MKKLEIITAEVVALVALVTIVGWLIYRNMHHG